MKKLLTLFLSLATFGLTSCGDAEEATFHELSLSPSPLYLFADQVEDSIKVYSTDNWTITTQSDWIGFNTDRTNKAVQGRGGKTTNRPLFFTPNTTGRIRGTYLTLSDGNTKASATVLQQYWLDIRTPGVTFPGSDPNSDNLNDRFVNARFVQELPVTGGKAPIEFAVYSDDATLSTTAEWVTPQTFQVQRGENQFELTIDANTTGEPREAILQLTSRGITNEIRLVQKHF